jgi:hypothetical protein
VSANDNSDDWWLYDARLTRHLAPWPSTDDAIKQFGRTFGVIADGH